jgi:hypothetical protein
MPTAYVNNEGNITILFSTRDEENKSRISSIIVSSKNPAKLISDSTSIILDIGKNGSFDDSGVMPSSLVKVGSRYYLYYIGWNERKTIPYHNSIGLAISDDGATYGRLFDGPIMERTHKEPYFCSAPCVIHEAGRWKMWYLSCTEWLSVHGKMEPRYHIKYAESSDGIHWDRDGRIAIDYKDPNEGGIVRASILKGEGQIYRMWFSYRNTLGYRSDSTSSYRMGYAESLNGLDWERIDGRAGITVSEVGWDSFMIAYPDVLQHEESTYMFYNGNGFGATGFGYALLDE